MSPRVTGRVGRGNPADATAASPAVLALADSVTTDAIQARGRGLIGRSIDADEMAWVVQRFFAALDETLDTLVGSLPKRNSLEEHARRLRELSDAMDDLADKHTERLDYERYSGLVQHAVELKTAATIITASDLDAAIDGLIADAQDHLGYVLELCEKGGDV